MINYLSLLPQTLPDLVLNTRWAEAFLLLGCMEQPGSHTPPGCSSILGHHAHASAGPFISSHPLLGLYSSILLLFLPCFNPLEYPSHGLDVVGSGRAILIMGLKFPFLALCLVLKSQCFQHTSLSGFLFFLLLFHNQKPCKFSL